MRLTDKSVSIHDKIVYNHFFRWKFHLQCRRYLSKKEEIKKRSCHSYDGWLTSSQKRNDRVPPTQPTFARDNIVLNLIMICKFRLRQRQNLSKKKTSIKDRVILTMNDGSYDTQDSLTMEAQHFQKRRDHRLILTMAGPQPTYNNNKKMQKQCAS